MMPHTTTSKQNRERKKKIQSATASSRPIKDDIFQTQQDTLNQGLHPHSGVGVGATDVSVERSKFLEHTATLVTLVAALFHTVVECVHTLKCKRQRLSHSQFANTQAKPLQTIAQRRVCC